MKRRLFWKILLAFWLTFFAITQGVWLLFEANRDRTPPPEARAIAAIAPALLDAGTQVVARAGPGGFGEFVAAMPSPHRERMAIAAAATQPPPSSGRILARTVTAPDGAGYTVRYSMPDEPPQRVLLLNMPPELFILGLIGGRAFSAALAWYLTAPISRLRQGFDELARGNLETRLALRVGRRSDEIADLAHDFDRMAQRLEELVLARDQLLHDVSHELRSPLARLRLAIGLARQTPERIDSSLERIDHEATRLDGLVGELLALSRLEHQGRDGEDYFDLAAVVGSVVKDARFEARSSGVTIELDEDIPDDEERPAVRGNGELVHRAIDNVVRNALRFSSSGDKVAIAIHLPRPHRHYIVEVADQGPGVDSSLIGTIFDPFVRGGMSKGAGLGLAIAQRAIAAHDGTIAAQNGGSVLTGTGLVITISLPVGGGPVGTITPPSAQVDTENAGR